MTDQCSTSAGNGNQDQHGSLWCKRGRLFLVSAYLFPILPLMILGAVLNEHPLLGAILGIIVGMLAGGFFCGLLAVLHAIKCELSRIARAVQARD